MNSKEALEQFEWLICCVDSDVKDGTTPYLEDEINVSYTAYNELEKCLDKLEIYENFTIPNLRKLILKIYNNEELTRQEHEIIFDIMSFKNEVENE